MWLPEIIQIQLHIQLLKIKSGSAGILAFVWYKLSSLDWILDNKAVRDKINQLKGNGLLALNNGKKQG